MTTFWLMPFRELARFVVWWLWAIPMRLLNWGWGLMLATDDNLRLFSNLKLWVALEPMFGDYDWKGHIIGFFLRGLRILATLTVYAIVLLICIALPLVWYGLLVAALISIFSR